MLKKMKDPVSCLTHLFGAVAAIPVSVLLIIRACKAADPWYIVSFSIFGAALFLLYSASTIYHMLDITEKASTVLRRIDHSMIFVLIAGTYTPICLVPLRGAWGWTFLGIIWGVAFGGILLKIFWIDAPRWLTSTIYVAMGWLVVIAFYPLAQAASATAISLLFLGGITYTLGAVIYATKWSKLNFKMFGFHEIFHLFVLGGSAFHVVLMFAL